MTTSHSRVIGPSDRPISRARSAPILKAFVGFGAFTTAGAGSIANFFGHVFPSQGQLAICGLIGGVVGAVYAAIVERPASDG